MKDQRVLAHCNLFGVLGAIPTLLELDADARALVKGKTISILVHKNSIPKDLRTKLGIK